MQDKIIRYHENDTDRMLWNLEEETITSALTTSWVFLVVADITTEIAD